MQITEKKQADVIVQFNQSAEEAKLTLKGIEKNIQSKADLQTRTLNNIKDKCRTQFETQRNNLQKYQETQEERQNAFSLNAVNKFDA